MQPWAAMLDAQDMLLASQTQPPTPKELETFDARISSYIHQLDRPLAGRSPDDAEGMAVHSWWAISRIVVHR